MNQVGTGIRETFFAAARSGRARAKAQGTDAPRPSVAVSTMVSVRMAIHVALSPPDPLSLRPAGRALAARRPAAPGAALPHADPQLLASRRCRGSTSSTGSRIRTATTSRGSSFPRQTTRAGRRGRPRRRDGGVQPVRLLPRAVGGDVSVRVRAVAREAGAGAVPRAAAGAARGSRDVSSAPSIARRSERSTSWSTLNRRLRSEIALRHPPGAGRADARGDAALGQRLVPRLGWLLVQVAAAPRAGGALRLRLPDSAHARREGARRPGRARRRTSPTCTPGPRSTCRARAGSASTRPPGCSPAKGTFRLPRRPIPLSAAPRHRRGRQVARSTFSHEMTRAAHLRIAARDQAVHRRAVAADRRARRTHRRASCRADDVRLTMGGEPTFVSIDDMDGDEWNFTALGADEARAGRVRSSGGCRTGSRPAALLHFGQGKWYPGESLPRWALGCYWRRDGVPIWKDDSPDRRRDDRLRPRRAEAQALHHGARRARSGSIPRPRHSRLRRRLVLPLARAAAAGQRRSAEVRAEGRRGARAAGARSSSKARPVVGYVLPLRRRADAEPGRAG